MYSILYAIKFVSDLRQVSGFLWASIKLTVHITEILLKVVLNTITPPFVIALCTTMPKMIKTKQTKVVFNQFIARHILFNIPIIKRNMYV
jgi:hypothetical protein